MLFLIALALYTGLTVALLQEDPEKRQQCLEILTQMKEIVAEVVAASQTALEQGREVQ